MSKVVSASGSNANSNQLGKKKTIRFVKETPAEQSFMTESKSLDSENDAPPKILDKNKLVDQPVNMDTFKEYGVSPLKKQKTMFANSK